MEQRFVIGKILKPKGLKGELKVSSYLDDIYFFETLDCLYLDGKNLKLNIKSLKVRQDKVYLFFEGYDTVESVDDFRNTEISVLQEDAPKLNEGEFFVGDILGAIVKDENGTIIGELEEIKNYGSTDVYTLKNKGKEIMFTEVEGLIETVDLEEKEIVVNSKILAEVIV